MIILSAEIKCNLEKIVMGTTTHRHRFAMEIVNQSDTPFYYYDMDVLHATLDEISRLTAGFPYKIHYAVKANGNPHILNEIKHSGVGVDLVSGGEIMAALKAGFAPHDMNFSGVGKSDWEIRLGLEHEIGCFNVESVPELDIIDHLASLMDKRANIAIRVNPDIDPHTHKNITTGTAENKFGIKIKDLEHIIHRAIHLPHIHLMGLHFHIGSQITSMQPYVLLCETINRLLDHYDSQGIHFEMINVGGGLGIDYHEPDMHAIPDFEDYFGTFKQHLHLRDNQQLHFELGRAIVGQCGTLFSRVVLVKENSKKFVVLDAGMNNLIRPALYEAYHEIQNLTSRDTTTEVYDVVGPVCESTDVFAHDRRLPVTHRGDLIAIRSTGAYGESMASTYNMRPLAHSIFHSSK